MGPLGEAIEEYMESALTHTGRNGAHKSFPHVTLCQFFKVSHYYYLEVASGRENNVQCTRCSQHNEHVMFHIMIDARAYLFLKVSVLFS